MSDALLQVDVLRALGLALLHFIWQGTALAVVALFVLRMLSGVGASTRYLCAAALLALAPVLGLLTIVNLLGSASGPPPPPTAVLEPLSALPAAARHSATLVSMPGVAAAWRVSDEALAVVALVWLCVVLVLSVRLAAAWRAAARLARTLAGTGHHAPAWPTVDATLARARDRMHVARPVAIAYLRYGGALALAGWMRATILLPVSVATSLSVEQLELLLAHELAHVRRHDYLANLCQTWIETLCFFHPAIWWLSGRVRLERELACDDAVVTAYGRPAEYGEALATLALLDAPAPSLALAARTSPLLFRIRRMLGVAGPEEMIAPRWAVALVAPIVLVTVLAGGQIATAQSTVAGIVADRADDATKQALAYRAHRNRWWTNSVFTQMAAADGQVIADLRLGPRRGALRLVARLVPVPGADTAISELRVELYGWTGRRSVHVLPLADRTSTDVESDSLLRTFIRESGLNASSRAGAIVRTGGSDALVSEARTIGDPVIAATYLARGAALVATPEARARCVTEALDLRNSPVDVARVVSAAMHGAESPLELAALVSRVDRVTGEAERLQLLVEAVQIAGAGRGVVREAVERVALTLPGRDARDAVGRALRERP